MEIHGAALWSVALSVSYKAPSSADLIAVAEIDPEKQARIYRRYFQGNTVLERVGVSLRSVGVSLRNGDEEVATAELTFFMRKSSMIKPSSPGANPHTLFEHKLKASARLIRMVSRHWIAYRLYSGRAKRRNYPAGFQRKVILRRACGQTWWSGGPVSNSNKSVTSVLAKALSGIAMAVYGESFGDGLVYRQSTQ